MNEQNYTSLELSKKLAENGCKLESKMSWYKPIELTSIDNGFHEFSEIEGARWIISDGNFDESVPDFLYSREYFSYSYYDILTKYAKEFFGKARYDCAEDISGFTDYYFKFVTKQILSLLQQNKKQEAEDYIWKHCKFNFKNK